MPTEASTAGNPTPESQAFLARWGYRHDLFISYSHGDIEGTGKSLLKDWSLAFGECLRDYLVGILKAPVSIYVDEGKDSGTAVNPMAPLARQLAQAIDQSALLQILMTPEYLASGWCKKELAQWLAGQPAKRGGPQDRIAIARVWGTEERNWPPAFKDQSGNVLPGFRFHDRKGEELPWGFGSPLSPPPNKEFSEEIIKLATYLKQRLRELDAEIEQQAKAQADVEKLQGGNAAIYLYARQAHRDCWLSTSADLDALGLQVRPGEPEPADADDDERQRKDVARIASQCQAMLLLGADGLALDADLYVVGHDRRNYVQSRYQKALPCAVVDRTGTLCTAARQRFASRLKIDWIEGTGPEWPGNLEAWIKRRASAQAADGYRL